MGSCANPTPGCIATGTNNDEQCYNCRYWQWSDVGCIGVGAANINQLTGQPQ
jgi:hypothetical protein